MVHTNQISFLLLRNRANPFLYLVWVQGLWMELTAKSLRLNQMLMDSLLAERHWRYYPCAFLMKNIYTEIEVVIENKPVAKAILVTVWSQNIFFLNKESKYFTEGIVQHVFKLSSQFWHPIFPHLQPEFVDIIKAANCQVFICLDLSISERCQILYEWMLVDAILPACPVILAPVCVVCVALQRLLFLVADDNWKNQTRAYTHKMEDVFY